MALPMWTMLTVIPVIKAIAWLLLSRLQGNKPHRGTLQNLPNPASGTYANTHRNSREPSNPPELSEPSKLDSWTYSSIHRNPPKSSGTVRNLPLEPTPFYSGTLRNLPDPASGSYTSTHWNSPEPSGTFQDLPEPTFRNLRQHTPEPSEIFRNLPELASPEPSGTCLRNLHQHTSEPSGTFRTRLRNLHQHTPELSGTFRNLPPEPAPATRTGTHRSLSGLKTPVAYAVGE